MVKEPWWPDASWQSYGTSKFQKSADISISYKLYIAITVRIHRIIIVQSTENCTSASKKINLMALIRTLTISTTTFEGVKEKFYGFRQTEFFEHFLSAFNALSDCKLIQSSFFNFYLIWHTWFDMDLALVDLDLKAYILDATWTWHVQNKFSDCISDIVFIRYRDNFLTRGCNKNQM